MAAKLPYNVMLIAIIFLFINNPDNNFGTANALSCQIGGRLACIGSCQLQNCGTGYCNSRDVCICSRCGSGRGTWKVRRHLGANSHVADEDDKKATEDNSQEILDN